MTAPLAHTDFNPDNEADRTRQLSLDVRRPSHAAASAYYSCALLDSALMGIPTELLGEVASACVAAIIAHHGAFIPKTANIDLGILALSKDWEQIVGKCGYTPNRETVEALTSERDRRGYLEQFLEMTTGRGNLDRWWPLVSYLTRTLRLSDQRATSEWACSE